MCFSSIIRVGNLATEEGTLCMFCFFTDWCTETIPRHRADRDFVAVS